MSSSIPLIEEIVLDKGDTGLGFNIRGGTDNIHVGNDPGIFVTTIKMNGAAAKDGRLQPGDKILEINGNDLREVQHHSAVSCFHSAGSSVNLLVERGAEQRIVSEHSDSRNDQMMYNSYNKAQSGSSSRGGLFGWLWFPITASILIGGSTLLLLWYLRRRR